MLLSTVLLSAMFISQTMISNMAVALYMPALNLAIHPRAGRGQHNHFPLARFRFSLLVTATMADGVSPTHHTVRVQRSDTNQNHGILKTAIVWR
jgi:hypothetical protein